MLRPQLDVGGKFLITIRRGHYVQRSHWDQLQTGKVLMVTQLIPSICATENIGHVVLPLSTRCLAG